MRHVFAPLLAATLVGTTIVSQAFAQEGGNLRATPVPGRHEGSVSEAEGTRGRFGGIDGPRGSGFDLDWYTADGGGAMSLAGDSYEFGATVGQPDAGLMSGGAYELGGGFWYGVASQSGCYANCDNSTTPPVLSANDFSCFLIAFAADIAYANCDGSSISPVLNANDFGCFLNAFATGCT